MKIFPKIILNGCILLLPILIWNITLTPKLPEHYSPPTFNSGIPLLISIGENIFRAITLIIPLLTIINRNSKKGFIIYVLGCLLYFTSWLMLIFLPSSGWSKSILGFTAPAYTPIIWLIGIAFMLEDYYFEVQYKKWHLIIPSILFCLFHISHAAIVYFRYKSI